MKLFTNVLKTLTLILFVLSLVSCSSESKPQTGNPAINQINSVLQNGYAGNRLIDQKSKMDIPSSVADALLPNLSETSLKPQKTTNSANSDMRRFNISVKNAPARSFFSGLVKGTKYNMIVDPDVTGNVTLDLKNVTIEETLNAVKDMYGYQYRKTPYGFEISPNALETRIFTVNYLNVSRTGKSYTSVSSGQITKTVSQSGGARIGGGTSVESTVAPSASVITTSNADFWKQLSDTLTLMIGDKDGRKVVINPSAGLVIIKAYPNELNETAKYLDSLQSTMTRQVILDTKILEVQLSKNYEAGVDWTLLGLSQEGNKGLTDKLEDIASNIFTLDMHSGKGFATIVKLLSTQGNVQVLSSPRISTLNNQKAVIKVGGDEFFITGISSTDTSGSSAGTTDTTQDVEFTPFFSGIVLDVTPEISASGDIILHIHPVVSEVTQKELEYTIGEKNKATTSSIPLAKSEIRESDSIVHAKNGQIVVIGGLMENKTKEHTGETPFVSKIPILGNIFRRTQQESVKSELIILLRPIVVDNNTWTTQLNKEAHTFRGLKRNYHFGPHPERFGNMAEFQYKKSSKKAAHAYIKTHGKKHHYSK